jgi:hypothetical protein
MPLLRLADLKSADIQKRGAPGGPLGLFLDLLADLLEVEEFLSREVQELPPLCFILTLKVFVIFNAIKLQHERPPCDHTSPAGEEISIDDITHRIIIRK